MKKLFLIFSALFCLISTEAAATYTPANPLPIFNGGTAATTAQGALNNLNVYPLGQAAYVVAQCNGGGDEQALGNAAIVAYRTLTSVLIPPGKAFHGGAGSQGSCVLNNTMSLSSSAQYAAFFGWPNRESYGSFVDFNDQKPTIRLANGFNPGDVNVDGFTTPGCFFNLNGFISISFRDVNINMDANTSNGAVAMCQGSGSVVGAEDAFSLDHASVQRAPNVFGCEISVSKSAVGTYTFTANPTDTQTIILNGVTWTFVASGASGTQTNIQGSAAATVAQLVTDLNASVNSSISVATYSASTLVLNISYDATGTVGNFYTLAAGTYGGTVSGATLTTGADPGNCVGTLGNNNMQIRATNSVFEEDNWVANGNIFDAFFRGNEIEGHYGAFSAITGGSFGSGSWIIDDNRFEFMGLTQFGAINGLGLVRTTIVGNDFDKITGPIMKFTFGYNNVIFVGNTVNGYGGPDVTIGTQTVKGDAAFVFASSTANVGHVIVSGNTFQTGSFGGSTANYLARFDGTTDNHIMFSSNVGGAGAYAIAPYLFNTETPTDFISDNLSDPHIEVGRNWSIGTLVPRASFDIGSLTSAYMAPLIAPTGTQTPLIVRGTTNSSIPSANNTAYYKLDDASGSTAVDAIAAANGTWHGTLGSQWGTGIINGDGVFNGTDNYIQTTYAGVGGTGARSISAWVKTTATSPSATPGNSPIVAYGTNVAGQILRILTNDTYGGSTNFNGLSFDPGGGAITYAAPNLYNGNWHFVVLTLPASATVATAKVYLDGVLLTSVVHSVSTGQAVNTGSTIPVIIGGDTLGNFFNGQIDEVSFWSRQITQNEITFLYNAGVGNQYPYSPETQAADLFDLTDMFGNVISEFTGTGTIGIGTISPLNNSFIDARGPISANALISNGTKFTTSGCSISSTTGGATAGKFTLGANSCTAIVTLNGATGLTAPIGWACAAWDQTAPAVLIGGNSSSTTATASFTIPAGAGATDVISFTCSQAY